MVSADTGGGGPLIGPVSIPAVLMSVCLYILIYFEFIFFRTRSFLKYICTYQGSEKRRSKTLLVRSNALGFAESLSSRCVARNLNLCEKHTCSGIFVLGEVARYEKVIFIDHRIGSVSKSAIWGSYDILMTHPVTSTQSLVQVHSL